MFRSRAGRARRTALLFCVAACAAATLIFAAATSSARAAVGDLTFSNCVGNLAGCAPTNPATAVNDVLGIAITPDGKNLYSAARAPGVVLKLDSAGNATFVSCIGSDPGCLPISPSDALSDARSLAFTPDGRHLYASSGTSIAHFALDTNGNFGVTNPLPADCRGSRPGCTATPVTNAISGGFVDLSLFRGHLYAGSEFGDNIANFSIGGTGSLTWVGCVGDLAGCVTTTPAGALNGSLGPQFTANGQHAYAPGFNSQAVTQFNVDAVGNLTFTKCYGALLGCTATVTGAVSGPIAILLTPDGNQLYLTAQNSQTISHFNVLSSGDLQYANCVGPPPCNPVAPSTALAGAFGLAVTPDGTSLYSAQFSGDNVSHFAIEQPPVLPPSGGGGGGGGGGVVGPNCLDVDHDGFCAGQDCNDNSPSIRPGAREIPGNRTDENCDGTAAPFPRVTSTILSSFATQGARTRIDKLTIQNATSNTTARVTCKGGGCPFKSKKAKKAKRGKMNLLGLFGKKHTLRAGATLDVLIMRPNFIGKLVRYKVRNNKSVKRSELCLRPGSTKPRSSCS